MKATILDLNGKKKKDAELPSIFDTNYRPNLIIRAISASQSQKKQPQGRDTLAGKRNTAESWGTGRGKARVPRIKGGGTRAANSGGFISMTVGGHLAHPPRSEKNLVKKINKKEKKLALNSAIAATANEKLIRERGHVIENLESHVLIFDDKIQTIKKTRDLVQILILTGLNSELERIKNKHIKSGKGKRRGRKYRRPKGPLIVAENHGIYEAARNIPGVDVVNIRNLCVEDLAPGSHAGRLTIWTESSFKAIAERV